MNRRGFLARLGGAILGAAAVQVIGPIEIAAPDPAVWKAAASLPRRPIANEFVTLQQMVGRAIEIVAKETEWLRLRREHDQDWYARRFGDRIYARRPLRFDPRGPFDLSEPIWEGYLPVDIKCGASATMRFEDDEIRGRSLPEFAKIHIEPAAHQLAEGVIRAVRAHGGGELLVTIDQRVDLPGVHRAAQVRGTLDGCGLGARAIHLPAGSAPDRYVDEVRIDMLFGIG